MEGEENPNGLANTAGHLSTFLSQGGTLQANSREGFLAIRLIIVFVFWGSLQYLMYCAPQDMTPYVMLYGVEPAPVEECLGGFENDTGRKGMKSIFHDAGFGVHGLDGTDQR